MCGSVWESERVGVCGSVRVRWSVWVCLQSKLCATAFVSLCYAPVFQSGVWCSSLRVYLQVEKQLSLTEEKFKDLYTYMDIMHMCPDELDGRY